MGTRSRREPWPWIVAGLLATMISISVAFLATAIAHPDPPVVDDAYRAGLEYAVGLRRPGTLPGPEAAASAMETGAPLPETTTAPPETTTAVSETTTP